MRQLGGKNNKNTAIIKNIAEFWYENLFFFVIFRNFAAHLRELCNRTWVREGVIGASEYSWSIVGVSLQSQVVSLWLPRNHRNSINGHNGAEKK